MKAVSKPCKCLQQRHSLNLSPSLAAHSLLQPRQQRGNFAHSTRRNFTSHPGAPITEQEVHSLQASWGKAIKSISSTFLAGGDFVAEAGQAADALYAYGHQPDILFKPTQAVQVPFRPTADGALSYFVGGKHVPNGIPEDRGFAHNAGLGWSDVAFENVQVDLLGDVAIAMGHYVFTQATGDGAGQKTRVEFSKGYKRCADGIARIFLQHSSVPFNNDSTPVPPKKTSVKSQLGSLPITEEDVHHLQASWGQAIKDVSKIYLDGGDFVTAANEAAGRLYAYEHSNVLFKPTRAVEHPFRPTADGALSYFVGGEHVKGGLAEDGGFGHNATLGWSDVKFKDVHVSLYGPFAIAMGHYVFTQATGVGAGNETEVEFTFGYKRDKNEIPRIFLQHSSMSFGFHDQN